MTAQLPALGSDPRPANRTHARPVTKLLFHTTEGSTVEGALRTYDLRGRIHPNVTYDPAKRYGVQHVDLDLPSYALRSSPSGHSYNRDGVVQIEIVGFAAQTHTYPDSWYQAFAEDVVADICRHHPQIDYLNAPVFYGSDKAYGTKAPSRFSQPQWANWNGLCGHQNAPDNSHWDPGQFRTSALQAHLIRLLEPAPPEATPDMPAYIYADTPRGGATAQYLYDGFRRIEVNQADKHVNDVTGIADNEGPVKVGWESFQRIPETKRP